MRAALRWAIATGEVESGLRLAGRLWLWYYRHSAAEGRRWAKELLALPGASRRSAGRGWCLLTAAMCAWKFWGFKTAEERAEESAAIAEELGDRRLLASALIGLGAALADRPEEGCRLVEEGINLHQEQGDFGYLGRAYAVHGWLLTQTGRIEAAQAALVRGRKIGERLGDDDILSAALYAEASIWLQQGDLERGGKTMEAALIVLRRTEDHEMAAAAVMVLGGAARLSGDVARAASLFAEALQTSRERGDPANVSGCMAGLAAVAAARGEAGAAARILGAVAAMRESSGAVPFPLSQRLEAGIPESIVETLGPQAFGAFAAEGRLMGENEAIRCALSQAAED